LDSPLNNNTIALADTFVHYQESLELMAVLGTYADAGQLARALKLFRVRVPRFIDLSFDFVSRRAGFDGIIVEVKSGSQQYEHTVAQLRTYRAARPRRRGARFLIWGIVEQPDVPDASLEILTQLFREADRASDVWVFSSAEAIPTVLEAARLSFPNQDVGLASRPIKGISDIPRTPKEVEKELFNPFNERGARISVRRSGEDRFWEGGMMDSWRVLRVATHDGKDEQADFWLLFRDIGWWLDPQQQYTHLVKVLSWEKTADGLRLYLDNGDALDVDFLWAEDDLELWKRIVEERTDEWEKSDKRQAAYIRDTYIPMWWGRAAQSVNRPVIDWLG
jgi:hypothetical protein